MSLASPVLVARSSSSLNRSNSKSFTCSSSNKNNNTASATANASSSNNNNYSSYSRFSRRMTPTSWDTSRVDEWLKLPSRSSPTTSSPSLRSSNNKSDRENKKSNPILGMVILVPNNPTAGIISEAEAEAFSLYYDKKKKNKEISRIRRRSSSTSTAKKEEYDVDVINDSFLSAIMAPWTFDPYGQDDSSDDNDHHDHEEDNDADLDLELNYDGDYDEYDDMDKEKDSNNEDSENMMMCTGRSFVGMTSSQPISPPHPRRRRPSLRRKSMTSSSRVSSVSVEAGDGTSTGMFKKGDYELYKQTSKSNLLGGTFQPPLTPTSSTSVTPFPAIPSPFSALPFGNEDDEDYHPYIEDDNGSFGNDIEDAFDGFENVGLCYDEDDDVELQDQEDACGNGSSSALDGSRRSAGTSYRTVSACDPSVDRRYHWASGDTFCSMSRRHDPHDEDYDEDGRLGKTFFPVLRCMFSFSSLEESFYEGLLLLFKILTIHKLISHLVTAIASRYNDDHTIQSSSPVTMMQTISNVLLNISPMIIVICCLATFAYIRHG